MDVPDGVPTLRQPAGAARGRGRHPLRRTRLSGAAEPEDRLLRLARRHGHRGSGRADGREAHGGRPHPGFGRSLLAHRRTADFARSRRPDERRQPRRRDRRFAKPAAAALPHGARRAASRARRLDRAGQAVRHARRDHVEVGRGAGGGRGGRGRDRRHDRHVVRPRREPRLHRTVPGGRRELRRARPAGGRRRRRRSSPADARGPGGGGHRHVDGLQPRRRVRGDRRQGRQEPGECERRRPTPWWWAMPLARARSPRPSRWASRCSTRPSSSTSSPPANSPETTSWAGGAVR